MLLSLSDVFTIVPGSDVFRWQSRSGLTSLHDFNIRHDATQSKRNLKVGHRVSWHEAATDRGTVIATDWSGVRLNGQR